MSVSDRDVVAALSDLDLLLSTVTDPVERYRLLTVAADLARTTLGPASDKALYEARLALGNNDAVVLAAGVTRDKVRKDINRHCAKHDLALPYRYRGPMKYVPIM
jgi:hypothetical protein